MHRSVSDAASPQAHKTTRSRVINTAGTRYHVVRAAAVGLGWRLWDHGTVVAVPGRYHAVDLESAERHADAGETYEVLWLDKSVLPSRVAGLSNFQRVNHFPGMNAIGRKAALFRRLMTICEACTGPTCAPPPPPRRVSCRTKVPDPIAADLAEVIQRFAPASFLSSRDLAALERYSRTAGTRAPYFIIKPNRSCQGRGIRLTKQPLEALTAAEHTPAEECLIQVYVDRPLLIEGKKFDLRLYVLLLSVSAPRWPTSSIPPGAHVRGLLTGGAAPDGAESAPEAADPLAGVSLFIHDDGLVRICAEPYARPTEENCTKASVHLTNYAVNKSSAAFCKPRSPAAAELEETEALEAVDGAEALDEDDTAAHTASTEGGNKRRLRFMPEFIEAATAGQRQWHNDVWRRVQECVTLTVLSGLHVLQRGLEESGGQRGNKADGRVCFELLGFDVMLREQGCEPVLMEVNHSPSLFCDSALDFAVKERVIADTLRLVDAHLAPRARGATTEKTYLAATQKHWDGLERAQEELVRSGEVHYHQLLPRRCSCGLSDEVAGAEGDAWTSEERQRQAAVATLSTVPR